MRTKTKNTELDLGKVILGSSPITPFIVISSLMRYYHEVRYWTTLAQANEHARAESGTFAGGIADVLDCDGYLLSRAVNGETVDLPIDEDLEREVSAKMQAQFPGLLD